MLVLWRWEGAVDYQRSQSPRGHSESNHGGQKWKFENFGREGKCSCPQCNMPTIGCRSIVCSSWVLSSPSSDKIPDMFADVRGSPCFPVGARVLLSCRWTTFPPVFVQIDSGLDVYICEEPDLVQEVAPMFKHKVHFCASKEREMADGNVFTLQSRPSNMRGAYWISGIWTLACLH